MLTLLLACTPRMVVTGLIHPLDVGVEIETVRGRHWRLSLGEEEALSALQDCTVEVTGPALGHRLWVRDWRVVDSAFGPGIFVGELREWGAGVAIEDRNTNTTLAVAPESGAVLRPYLGEIVLIAGPVVGNREIQVVAFRVLTGPEAAKGDAPDEAPPKETPAGR